MKKNHWMIILSIYFLVVFFGCAGQAIGTIKGKLVRNNGAPVEKIDMQLLKVIDQGNNEFSWVATAYKATSDEQGDFFFEKVESDKYMIVVLNVTFKLGSNPPPMEEMVIRNKDNSPLIIEVTHSKGIDLGELTWNK